MIRPCVVATKKRGGGVAASPSKMESSSLQPVVIWMMSPRCSAMVVAVVKPMGTNFQAANALLQGTRMQRCTVAALQDRKPPVSILGAHMMATPGQF